jgi:hypothetical protein
LYWPIDNALLRADSLYECPKPGGAKSWAVIVETVDELAIYTPEIGRYVVEAFGVDGVGTSFGIEPLGRAIVAGKWILILREPMNMPKGNGLAALALNDLIVIYPINAPLFVSVIGCSVYVKGDNDTMLC